MFKISQERLQEMAKIESESNCDISAGFDWGEDTVQYLQSFGTCLSTQATQEGMDDSLNSDIESVS